MKHKSHSLLQAINRTRSLSELMPRQGSPRSGAALTRRGRGRGAPASRPRRRRHGRPALREKRERRTGGKCATGQSRGRQPRPPWLLARNKLLRACDVTVLCLPPPRVNLTLTAPQGPHANRKCSQHVLTLPEYLKRFERSENFLSN